MFTGNGDKCDVYGFVHDDPLVAARGSTGNAFGPYKLWTIDLCLLTNINTHTHIEIHNKKILMINCCAVFLAPICSVLIDRTLHSGGILKNDWKYLNNFKISSPMKMKFYIDIAEMLRHRN